MRSACCFRLLAAAGVTLLQAGGASAQQSSSEPYHSASHELVTPDGLKWEPIPREWTNGPPPSVGGEAPRPEIALIWGDPGEAGEPFMFRLRSSKPGTTPVPPHSHPADERITVLSGVFCVGTGDKYDPANCKEMPAGSYIMMPKGMHHFAVAKDSVIEIYGIGPFKINWLK